MQPDTRSDAALLADLGRRAEQLRVSLNLSQQEVAERAGVGKRTLERFEAGESTTTTNLARILRALGQPGALADLIPEPTVSPLELLRAARQERRRASPRRRPTAVAPQAIDAPAVAPESKAPAPAPAPPTPFPWGDERGGSS